MRAWVIVGASSWIYLTASLTACATPSGRASGEVPAPVPENTPAATSLEVSPPHFTQGEAGSFHYEFSSSETQSDKAQAVNGSIAVIKIRLPADWIDASLEISGDFSGAAIPFYPIDGGKSYEAILGVPYECPVGPTSLKVHLAKGTQVKDLQIPFQVNEGRYASEVLKVHGRRVNPTRPADLKRINLERIEIGQAYRRMTLKKFWQGPFELPIQSRVTSAFGTRRVYNGVLKSFHTGLDLKAAMNTPIHAAAPGIVALSKNLFYTGNTVILDHGYGILTVYAHMNLRKVKVGDVVDVQQILGLSGKTGRVNGPHLHWQGIAHQVKVNPLGLVQVVK